MHESPVTASPIEILDSTSADFVVINKPSGIPVCGGYRIVKNIHRLSFRRANDIIFFSSLLTLNRCTQFRCIDTTQYKEYWSWNTTSRPSSVCTNLCVCIFRYIWWPTAPQWDGGLSQSSPKQARCNVIYLLQLLIHLVTFNFPHPIVVSRLDLPTSGLVVIPRRPSVAKKMRAEIDDHKISKTYYARVQGKFPL